MDSHHQSQHQSGESIVKLHEAIVLGQDHQEPLQDSDTIRVYHGAREKSLAYQAVTRGLSGDMVANRAYSYELNNNPRGLFVTPDLSTAKEFGDVVIEFHARVMDLESPVWPNGTFTSVGQMSGMFGSDQEREEERIRQRMNWSESEYEFVVQSDRPEVAAMLIMGGERQALFTGDLNPNSVRAVWVPPSPSAPVGSRNSARLSPREFIQSYRGPDVDRDVKRRLLDPQDAGTGEEFLDALIDRKNLAGRKTRQEVADILLKDPSFIDRSVWSDRQASQIRQDIEQDYG